MAGTIIGYDQDGNPHCRCGDGNVYANCGPGCECCDQVAGKTIVGYDEDGNPNCKCEKGNIYTNCGPNCECCDQVGFLTGGYGLSKQVRKANSTAKNKATREKKLKTANKVIRSNSVNQNFDVEYSVTKEKVGSSVAYKTLNPLTKLVITPKPGFVIDAKNFTTSSLPREVESVVYINDSKEINESNKVIANVLLKPDFVMPKDFINIVIPVNGIALKPYNKLNLTLKFPKKDNVLVSNVLNNNVKFADGTSGGSYHPSDNLLTTSYRFSGSGKTKVTKMTFSVPSNEYFDNEPSYIIDSRNKKNYKITKKDIRDRRRRLKSRAFEIVYTFPKEAIISNNDIITFNANASVIKKKEASEGYRKEAPTIYAFNTGTTIRKNGGHHPITVTGTPGAKFKILIQDDSQNIYDISNGAFGVGGSPIEGEIPSKKPGQKFATWKKILNIPKTDASRNIEMRLLTVDNNKAEGESAKFTRILYNEIRTKKAKAIEIPTVKQSINITNSFTPTLTGGYAVENIPLTSATTISVGPGRLNTNGEIIRKSWIVSIASPSGSQGIVIARQPRFVYGGTYAAWGTLHSDHTKNLDSSSVRIPTDWNISDNKSNKYKITASVSGLGESTSRTPGGSADFGRSTAFDTYQQVEISVIISGITYGTAAISPSLTLDNFLEIITHGS